MNATIEGGLIVTEPGKCAGYVFNFGSHGGFDPNGKIQIDGRDVTDTEVRAHNAILEKAEVEAAKKHGQAVFYMRSIGNHTYVSTWAGGQSWSARCRDGRHNMAGKRRDFWFTIDGENWHGVNIGDNDIVRCKRVKS